MRFFATIAIVLAALCGHVVAQTSTLPGFPPGAFSNKAARDPPAGGGGGCTQATNFIGRLGSESTTVKNALTTMICGMVTDGLITGTLGGTTTCGALFDVIHINAVDTQADALLNVCGTSYSQTANNTPTFTADAGFNNKTIGASPFENMNFNASTTGGNYSQNSAHLSVCVIETGGGGTQYSLAAVNTGSLTGINIYPKFSDNNTYIRVNDSPESNGIANAGNTTGHWLGNRNGSATSQKYLNGTSIGTSTTGSTSLPNSDFYVGATSVGVPEYDGLTMAVSFGASLTSTQVSNFYSRLSTYMTTVHGSSC